MHLLVVEDDPLNIELFQDILEGSGHTVVVATDGHSGRETALAGTFDLIFLDIQLPVVTGDLVCEDLRAAGVMSSIIALSANAVQSQIDRSIQAGFTAYLTKPITPDQLRAAVIQYAT